jgi:hypothetical protein
VRRALKSIWRRYTRPSRSQAVEITTRAYWRQARAWAVENTDLFAGKNIVNSLGIGVLACIFQGICGLRLMSLTFQFILTIIAAYFTVSFFKFMGNWLIYAPVAFEQQRQAQIESQKQENVRLREQLQAPKPLDPIAVVIQQVNWSSPRVQPGVIEASFHIRIRNGSGVPTTFDDWELRSKSQAGIKSKVVGFQMGSPNDPTQTDVRYHPLAVGASAAGSVAFHVTGIGLAEAKDASLEWFLEFVDAASMHHIATIPTERY